MPIISLKNIFHIDRSRSANNPENSPIGDNPDNSQKNVTQRIEEIYGPDQIKRQLLYEKWVVKEDWRLKDEAIPLLMALDPDNQSCSTNIDLNKIYNDLWSHARNCSEQGLLKVKNPEQPPEEWRARPADVYCWAKISRIEIPDTLGRLMEFVINTVKQTVTGENKPARMNNLDPESGEYALNREKILGMALAILVAYPEQCKNGTGQVTVENILKLIDEKSHIWPAVHIGNLPLAVRRDLLEQWLKR